MLIQWQILLSLKNCFFEWKIFLVGLTECISSVVCTEHEVAPTQLITGDTRNTTHIVHGLEWKPRYEYCVAVSLTCCEGIHHTSLLASQMLPITSFHHLHYKPCTPLSRSEDVQTLVSNPLPTIPYQPVLQVFLKLHFHVYCSMSLFDSQVLCIKPKSSVS